MGLEFTWDERKATSNRRKHRIDFHEAATVFGDPRSLTVDDPGHSFEEPRYFTLGRSSRGRLLAVAHTEIEDVIRIISARRASRREAEQYEDT